MESDVAISVETVSKKYCKSLKRGMAYGLADLTRNLFGLRSRSGVLRPKEFWAVDDVSFDVRKGETLGLIGPNGAGKTTLLQMLNGIVWPDKGRIAIRGRVGALISVGAGFHPQLTGRENIYVNAAILGMSKQEVNRRFDQIVGFADIGDFLDTPVKHYSSGMFVRLGFAVAVHCEPDILLVDEVLAVGDKDFQHKCFQKIGEIKKRGTTVVLVTHNDYTIREQCRCSLYLKQGRVCFYGDSAEAIQLYSRDVAARTAVSVQDSRASQPEDKMRACIEELSFHDDAGRTLDYVDSGATLHIRVVCSFKEGVEAPVLGVMFYDVNGLMFSANNEYDQVPLPPAAPGKTAYHITIPSFHLPASKYAVSATINDGTTSNCIDWRDRSYELVVGRPRNARGRLELPTQWRAEQMEAR